VVRKIFLILISFLFLSCASKPVLDDVNPQITITFNSVDSASISVLYTADKWAFINGVELKNAAGDVKKYMFKDVRRQVSKGGAIFEGAVITLFNSDDPYIKITDVEKLRAFIGGGAVTARPLADRRTFAFGAVDILAEY
jgi:hypothetical protein